MTSLMDWDTKDQLTLIEQIITKKKYILKYEHILLRICSCIPGKLNSIKNKFSNKGSDIINRRTLRHPRKCLDIDINNLV